MEAMIASALLATSVIGVSGTILSSYAHDQQSAAQGDAVSAAEALMGELTALPFAAGSTSDVGLMDFASYSDTTTSGQTMMATAKMTESREASSGSNNQGSGNNDDNHEGISGVLGQVVGVVGGLLGTSSSGGNSGSGSSGSGSGSAGNTTPAASTATPTLTPRIAYRTASVTRKDTINGVTSATGDLAIITVDAKVSSGQTIRIRRLVSSTEAASIAMSASRN